MRKLVPLFWGAVGCSAAVTPRPHPEPPPATLEPPASSVAEAPNTPAPTASAPSGDSGAAAMMRQKRQELEAREKEKAEEEAASSRPPDAPFSYQVAGFRLTMKPGEFSSTCKAKRGEFLRLPDPSLVACTVAPEPPPFFVDAVLGRVCKSGNICELFLRLWGVNVEKPNLAQRANALGTVYKALVGKYGKANTTEGHRVEPSELPSLCFNGTPTNTRYIWTWMVKPEKNEDLLKIGRLVFAYTCARKGDDLDDSAVVIYQNLEEVIERMTSTPQAPSATPPQLGPTGNGGF